MISLGRNILSENVQRNLGRATKTVSDVSERLSSGQRINKAADDAAGLAISLSLNTDGRIFAQGIRNLNDGISLSNIGESAIGELKGILTRVQELTTQSINSTYSDTQRSAMQKEVTALQSEYNRIVESTSFNGINVLTGSNTRTVLQGGTGTENTLALQFGKEALAGGFDNYAGGTTRVSTSSTGVEGSDYSFATAISADGRYVAFWSSASNLVAGDTNGVQDSFIKDTVTGATTRISTDSSGNEGNGRSYVTAISSNGRYVAFRSEASNLVAGDTNGVEDAFIKDILTGVTTRISTDSSGNQGNAYSHVSAISADGRYVAFASSASNLVAGDTNGTTDSFIKDTLTGITTRISTDSSGNQGNSNSFVNAISADGRYVAFQSTAFNLVAGDTNGVQDSFIKDIVTGVTTRISTDSSGTQGNANSFVTAISADGRYVAFQSSASNLVAGDTNGTQDSFIKDTATGTTTRISTDSSGNQGNASSSVTAISTDGRYVAFYSSASNLVAGDTNGVQDSFIKDTATGVTTRISTDSSGNQGNGDSSVRALSADGRYALFDSFADNLVSGDTNGQPDVFLRDLSKSGIQQLSGLVISNQVSAKVTLDLLQTYSNELTQYQSKIGANTSRISYFTNVLEAAKINYKAAESRITDADIASETSKLVASQIRQQVATSLVGQANQAPQIAINLLRNA